MTNNEALQIAASYDIIAEMTGMDFEYSQALVEESKKVMPVQTELDKIQDLLKKKLAPLHEKKQALEADGLKPTELKKVEDEIKLEADKAQKLWNKIVEAEFKETFVPIELSKVPTDTKYLDARLKDGVSIGRSALVFLTKKGLVKK